MRFVDVKKNIEYCQTWCILSPNWDPLLNFSAWKTYERLHERMAQKCHRHISERSFSFSEVYEMIGYAVCTIIYKYKKELIHKRKSQTLQQPFWCRIQLTGGCWISWGTWGTTVRITGQAARQSGHLLNGKGPTESIHMEHAYKTTVTEWTHIR